MGLAVGMGNHNEFTRSFFLTKKNQKVKAVSTNLENYGLLNYLTPTRKRH